MLQKIALAGNPNSGKTTMFNALTGSNQYVGNWPGVTVEKKEGFLKQFPERVVVDLPGIYSLSPYTLEERVARQYLLGERPAAIINLVDASNLERNLYLTLQLIEMGIPTVIALNMMDIVHKRGDRLDSRRLAEELGCPCFETSALKNKGLNELVAYTVHHTGKNSTSSPIRYSKELESTLGLIESLIEDHVPTTNRRAAAIKLFERDAVFAESLELPTHTQRVVDEVTATLEHKLGDSGESIVADNRYEFIESVVKKCLRRKPFAEASGYKIDRVATHKYLAFPLFFAVMFGVYYLSISFVGKLLSKFASQDVFRAHLIVPLKGVLLHRGVNPILVSLLADGIVSGVSSVLSFLPQLVILFFLLALLEDCGYMARTAFIMDKIFFNFGLSGKSFISLLVGSGCSVPGIMASRTVAEESERKITIITTSFIPCGAKMPVIALFAGVFFGDAWWIAPLAYFLGIFAVAYSGLVLKKLKLFEGGSTPFIMELPPYRLPSLKNVLLNTWMRCSSFIKKAGTVILLASVAVWFLSGYQFTGGQLSPAEHLDQSMIAAIGNAIAPIFAPLGFGSWQAGVATFLGLIAKEEIVSVFGVLFGLSHNAPTLLENGQFAAFSGLAAHFGLLSAASFLIFNLLCAPCVAAMSAIKREMNSLPLTLFSLAYQTGFAYCVCLVVYQFGLVLSGSPATFTTLLAGGVLGGMLFLLFYKPNEKKEKVPGIVPRNKKQKMPAGKAAH